MKIYREDRTPQMVKLEISHAVEPQPQVVDLRAVLYRRINDAISGIADVEHLGEMAALRLIPDARLTEVRSRLWRLLERLDDEADRRR